MGKSLLFQCLSNTNAMQHKRRLLLYIISYYQENSLLSIHNRILEFSQNYPPKINLLSFIIHNF